MELPGLAEWLAEELRLRGWTPAELARRASLSEGAVSLLLRGERTRPRRTTQVKLAQALGIPHRELIHAILEGHHPEPTDIATTDRAERTKRTLLDDPNLTASQARALIAVYEQMVRGGRSR